MINFSSLKEKFNSLRTQLHNVVHSFSYSEKIALGIFGIIVVISTFLLINSLSNVYSSIVPQFGGNVREGVIGIPRFINPVLAISDTDKDLVALTYSGLTKLDIEGKVIPDLAKSFEISDDGLEYTFTIKDNVVFHDNTPVTANDVIFTIKSIQNPSIKSPQLADWNGIKVEKINDKKLVFKLPEAYEPFILNTTIGILPEHLWKDVQPEEFAFHIYNTEPVGSGPFSFAEIKRHKSGIPLNYTLESFKKYSLGRPFLSKIEISFFSNEDELIKALDNGTVESAYGISAKSVKSIKYSGKINQTPLPRIFSIFLNQNESDDLTNDSIRKILNYSINRELLVDELFNGGARPSYSPIPPEMVNFETFKLNVHKDTSTSTDDFIVYTQNFMEEQGITRNASGTLEKKGKPFPISFSLATSNIPELVQTAEFVSKKWKSLGIDVELKIFEPNDLTQNVIRTRKYDAMLFGQVIGRDLDLYAFWHSSQREDPGLNISEYANVIVDKKLNQLRTTADLNEKEKILKDFENEIEKDTPVIFLYSPNLIYLTPNKLQKDLPEIAVTPSERFLDVHHWFVNTEKVWNFLKKTSS